MTPEPRIVTLTGDVAAADPADAAILTDPAQLQNLIEHRGHRCAVGGLPIALAPLSEGREPPVAVSHGGLTPPALRLDVLQFGTVTFVSESSVFHAASKYCVIRRIANRKLAGTLVILLGIVGLLTALIAFTLLVPPAIPNPLLDQVRAYQRNEPPQAERLSTRAMPRFQKALTAIRLEESFTALPRDARQFVMDRLREFEAYSDYRNRFDPPTIRPHDIRTLTELDGLEKSLASDLQPPPEFAAAWSGTEAVALRTKWQTDADLIRRHERALTDWHRDRIRRGTDLNLNSMPDARWRNGTDSLLKETAPLPLSGPVNGSSQLSVKHGAVLDAAGIHEMIRVEKARDDWAATRRRLLVNRCWYDMMLTFGEWFKRSGSPVGRVFAALKPDLQ